MSDSVKIIVTTFDSILSLEKQISATCKSAQYHLHLLSRIKKYLMREQIISFILAYVTSWLDQNNSLLIFFPRNPSISSKWFKIQLLIMGMKKADHITPILIKLHWLPVDKCVIIKVLLLVYKSLHGQGRKYLTELFFYMFPQEPWDQLQKTNVVSPGAIMHIPGKGPLASEVQLNGTTSH